MNLPTSFDSIEDIQTRFEEARGIVRQNIIDARRRQKYAYDKSHRKLELNVGQKVLIYTKTRKVGLSEKLINNFNGPFVLVKKVSPVTYIAEDLRTRKQTRAHIDRIKVFYDDELDHLEDKDIWNIDEREVILKQEYKKSDAEAMRAFEEDLRTASVRSISEEDMEATSSQQ